MQLVFILAFLNSLIFLVSIYLIHIIKRDLLFLPNALSKYALGKYGWILSLGLFAIGSAQIFLSLGLAKTYNFSLGNGLLICAGIATFFIALYKMEYPNKTFRGLIHTFAAGLQFISFPVALIFLNYSFKGAIFYLTISVYIANFIFLVMIFIYSLNGMTHKSSHFGAVQKTNIILMTIWVAVVSLNYIF